MSILVIDAGTTTVRVGIILPDGSTSDLCSQLLPPQRLAPGIAEFDANALGDAALGLARKVLDRHGSVDGIGIASQRSSCLVWDRQSGQALGPGIGWQDLRTTGRCLGLAHLGIRLSPSQSATKIEAMLAFHDPKRELDLCVGTIDSWLIWKLSEGSFHVTDATNAGVTGLVTLDGTAWDPTVLDALGIDDRSLPRIVDTSGAVGIAHVLPGTPPIAALVGDQQSSLVGQGCIAKGAAKATFGTGGMLDLCLDTKRPDFPTRGPAGTFPIIAWQREATITWGIEAVMLSAGSCIDWLVNGIGLIGAPSESDALGASVKDAGGVTFVPALEGMGTPTWDFGARGAFIGMSGATTRGQLVRAVLEGIAHRGADLLEAAELDSASKVSVLHVDGGMSANETFVQILANATQRPIALAANLEATLIGAGLLAGIALGIWPSLDDAVATQNPRAIIEPTRYLDRDRWIDARNRTLRTVPALSAISF